MARINENIEADIWFKCIRVYLFNINVSYEWEVLMVLMRKSFLKSLTEMKKIDTCPLGSDTIRLQEIANLYRNYNVLELKRRENLTSRFCIRFRLNLQVIIWYVTEEGTNMWKKNNQDSVWIFYDNGGNKLFSDPHYSRKVIRAQ